MPKEKAYISYPPIIPNTVMKLMNGEIDEAEYCKIVDGIVNDTVEVTIKKIEDKTNGEQNIMGWTAILDEDGEEVGVTGDSV